MSIYIMNILSVSVSVVYIKIYVNKVLYCFYNIFLLLTFLFMITEYLLYNTHCPFIQLWFLGFLFLQFFSDNFATCCFCHPFLLRKVRFIQMCNLIESANRFFFLRKLWLYLTQPVLLCKNTNSIDSMNFVEWNSQVAEQIFLTSDY